MNQAVKASLNHVPRSCSKESDEQRQTAKREEIEEFILLLPVDRSHRALAHEYNAFRAESMLVVTEENIFSSASSDPLNPTSSLPLKLPPLGLLLSAASSLDQAVVALLGTYMYVRAELVNM